MHARRLATRAASLALVLLPSGPGFAASGAPGVDLADFDFVTTTVAENYAGWETKTAGPRREELAALTARLRAQVAEAGEAASREALERWVAWFDDGHLRLQWAAATQAPAWRAARRALDEPAARARLAAPGVRRDPIEGLWAIDDAYRLAVVRRTEDARRLDAIVLATTVDGWSAGEVKATLATRPDGRYDVRYGTGDRSEARFVAALLAAGEVLDTGDYGAWRRVHDDPVAAARALRRWPGDAFALQRLDADTLYLRLPSFHDAHAATVRALVESHAAELARTPQLVIDVRGNGGGSDFVYEPLLPLLCTRPIYRIGVELRASPVNARLRREVAGRLQATAPEAARVLSESSARMEAASTPFVPGVPHPFRIVGCDAPAANPARVAVLIDRAASSAENFLLDARQSRKVVLMGQQNSTGTIDFGEMMGLAAPSGRFQLLWATSRSLRLPADPVDPHGLAPDVRIPAEVADPVAHAAQALGGASRPAP